MRLHLVILASVFHIVVSQVEQTYIPEPHVFIAGIFDEKAEVEQRAFRDSLERAHGYVKLKSTIRTHYAVDSFTTWQTACTLDKAVAVFGPQVASADGALREACAAAHLPHLQAAWQPPEPEKESDQDPCFNVTNPCSEDSLVSRCCFVSLNFHPEADEVSHAVANALMYSGWTSFTILYEDNFGLMRVQKLMSTLNSLSSVNTPNVPILVRRLKPGEDNQAIFKELNELHESRVVLDCHVDRVMDYLSQAAKSEMLNDYQSYFLTTLEAHSISQSLVNMELRSNVSWLSMFEIENRLISDDPLKDKMKPWYGNTTLNTTSIKLETFLVADVVTHLSTALSNLTNDFENEINIPPTLCSTDSEGPWMLGPKLQTTLRQTKSTGYSGNIEFGEGGERINYRLFLHEMQNGDDPRTIIAWDSATKSFDESTKVVRNNVAQLSSGANRTKLFIVMSKVVEPYFKILESTEENELRGNDRYEGFSVDLISEIFRVINNSDYKFEFRIPEQNTQGKYNPKTRQWDGLIGAVLTKKADLAICDLTITEERKSVVDFSVPFMTLGISILFTKQHSIQPGRFSFLNPYSMEVWIYTATAYLVVSIVLFVSSRISPGDWENPQPCEKEPEELENIWNFKNCTWLTMGSIMTQGCDILPKAIGSRWVCGMWWFFAMIVCQTYIAQLAASLTSALEDEPINSVEDLANQKKISYGCMADGSTAQFFARSKDKMFEKMWMKMNASRPPNLCKTNEEGAHRVLKGKNRFAFFMESTTIEYITKRECKLAQIGNRLDSKDYGIAMPANSPFRSKINRAILHMQQTGSLETIKTTWWEKKYDAQDCPQETDDMEGDLEISNLIGAFLVLLAGCALSVVIAAFEFLDHVRNIVISERISHREAFVTELKASLNLFKLQKPVLGKPSRSPSLEPAPAQPPPAPAPRPIAAAAASFIDCERLGEQ